MAKDGVAMEELGVEETRSIQLEILSNLDRFCTEHDIRYFLSGGTLLGAIRHKGFIPWDDDIDLAMPRADYERFLAEYSDPRFFVYSPKTSDPCRFPFAKLCDSTTMVFEGAYRKKSEFGLNIDIFPLDVAPDDDRVLQGTIGKSQFFQQLLKVKLTRPSKRLPLSMNIGVVVGRIVLAGVSTTAFARKIDRIASSWNDGKTTRMGCMVWGYRSREILDNAVFASSVPVEFENLVFPAPVGYHTYLSSLYGDYMQLPPEEKRVTHHDFVACRAE
jgi:lipopolysaccharide cholinephosphotransferase